MATGDPPAQQVNQKPAVDVALAEFNALRAEINNRMTTQAALVGVGLTAIGVIIGLVVQEDGDERLLLAVPPIAVAINFLWAVETRQISFIGRYIRTSLWDYLTRADQHLPSWEDDVEARRRGAWNVLRTLAIDYTMPVALAGAAMAALAVLGTSVEIDGRDEPVSAVLRIVDWALAVVALVVPFWMTPANWWPKGQAR